MAMIEANDLQLERDGIAKVISDYWDFFNAKRVSWIEETQDIRSYLSSGSTSGTQVGSLGWKNSTTIPKLTQIFDNLKAYYMAALFPDDGWFIFKGSNPEAHIKAKVIERFLLAKLEDSGFQEVIDSMLVDWIVYGVCFGGVTWREVEKIDPSSKETIVRKGPEAYRISPLDVLIDPSASSFEESPFLRRTVMPLNVFMTKKQNYWDNSAINNILDSRSSISEDMVDQWKRAGMQVDGFPSYHDYLTSGYVEYIEYYGDIWNPETNEILSNRQIGIVDRRWVLFNRESPSWSYNKPFVMCGWRKMPDDLLAHGPLQQLVGMQYRCDHLENAKADIFDQIIHPVVKIKGDSVEDFQFGPGVIVRTGMDGDIEFISPDPQALLADNQISFYHNMMEQMAGAPREMMGFRTPGEKTAFEVGVLQQGADRMFLDKLNQFEEKVIKPMLNMMFELIVRNLEVGEMVRTLNQEGDGIAFLEITKEDIMAPGIIQPVGSKHYAARIKRVQELQNFISILLNPVFQPHFSAVQAGEMLEKELGFEHYEIFNKQAGMREQFELQAEAQMMQQMLGAEGEQPIT